MIEFRNFQCGDEVKVVQLLETVFKGWPKFDLTCSPLDHWRWKFIDNRFKVQSIALALDHDEIIGCFHILPQMLKIGDQNHLVGQEQDVGVHNNYRGQGIYNRFLPLREELTRKLDMKLSYGLGGNPILIKHVKSAGERRSFPFKLQKMVKIRDIDLHLHSQPSEKTLTKKYGYHVLKSLNLFKLSVGSSDVLPSDFKISDIKQFSDGIDGFCDQINDYYKFIIVRDKNYLNWRYCDPRGGKYLVKIAEGDNQILGFSVLRVNRRDSKYPIGYIVDLLALPHHFKVVKKLVVDAITYFDNLNINCINVSALQNSHYDSLLHKMGFINNVSNTPFLTYRSYLTNNETDVLNNYTLDDMHYSYGDYDHI